MCFSPESSGWFLASHRLDAGGVTGFCFCPVPGLHFVYTQQRVCASIRRDRAHSPAQASHWQNVPQVWGTVERYNRPLRGEGDVEAAPELGSSNRSCKQSRCDSLSGFQLKGNFRDSVKIVSSIPSWCYTLVLSSLLPNRQL